jgi:hypothetical protein
MSGPDPAGVVLGYLSAQDGYVSADDIGRATGLTRPEVGAGLDALTLADRLGTARSLDGGLYRLRPRPAPPASGVPVTVDAGDLEYLIAHYRDEVDGRPHRSHWRLPLLAAAVARLEAEMPR